MLKVTTVYRVRIDLNEHGEDDRGEERFHTQLFKLECAKKYKDIIDVKHTGGGPAWNGYMYIECLSKTLLRQFCASVATIGARTKTTLTYY